MSCQRAVRAMALHAHARTGTKDKAMGLIICASSIHAEARLVMAQIAWWAVNVN
jgi:hypothetical protein